MTDIWKDPESAKGETHEGQELAEADSFAVATAAAVFASPPPVSVAKLQKPATVDTTAAAISAQAAVTTETAVAAEQAPADSEAKLPSVAAVKTELLDAVYGTARGLTASQQQRGNIEERLTELEMRNPSPSPLKATTLLPGRWKLVYTSHTQTLLVLNAIQSIPMADIGDVYQIIEPDTLTAQNKIDIAVPFAMAFTAQTGFEALSARAYKVRFTKIGMETYIQTPQLLANLELPATVQVLGNTLDLSPLRDMLKPLNSGIESAQSLMTSLVAPEFPVLEAASPSLWLVTTYLDSTMRISRDDNGRVFVMLKDGPAASA